MSVKRSIPNLPSVPMSDGRCRATQGEQPSRSTPVEILQERFARGEIRSDEMENATGPR
jgi:uncharacterized membrane protein